MIKSVANICMCIDRVMGGGGGGELLKFLPILIKDLLTLKIVEIFMQMKSFSETFI